MKRLVILAIAVAIGAGCTQRTADPSTGTSDGDDRAGGAANQTPDGRVGHTGDRPQIYAAVIRQLVTKDHTFGRGTSPFKRVYVVDGPSRTPEILATSRSGAPRAHSRTSSSSG